MVTQAALFAFYLATIRLAGVALSRGLRGKLTLRVIEFSLSSKHQVPGTWERRGSILLEQDCRETSWQKRSRGCQGINCRLETCLGSDTQLET